MTIPASDPTPSVERRLQLAGYVARLREAERGYYRAQSQAAPGELEALRQDLERARIEACGWLKTLHDEGTFLEGITGEGES